MVVSVFFFQRWFRYGTLRLMNLSIVVPVLNEESTVCRLASMVDQTVANMKLEYELLFIDDGSTDETVKQLEPVVNNNESVRVIECRKNFGKSTALDIGFKMARGDVIITMDGDLQDDPCEIPRMLEKLNEGFDVVSGWKKTRHDPLGKRIPSKLFNAVTAKLSGVAIHDFNCGFKAYQSNVVKSLNIYGEMHRYIPALAAWKGFRVTEIPVQHHARGAGKSKYGVERFLRGLLDFLTIAFMTNFNNRPMHFFGLVGFILVLMGGLSGGYLGVQWCRREFFEVALNPIGTRPLLTFSVLTTISGMIFFSTGLLAEMIINLSRPTTLEDHLVKKVYESASKLDSTTSHL